MIGGSKDISIIDQPTSYNAHNVLIVFCFAPKGYINYIFIIASYWLLRLEPLNAIGPRFFKDAIGSR